APQTPAGTLDDSTIASLWKAARRVSREALRIVGTDWGDLPDAWLMNHRWRDGGLCPRRGCRAPLLRADLRGRTTCWCPRCQG
ncbi:MAG TPA: Fpg/Nei family DNA glycosylase, partial [Bacteroidia bacterium]|nr:Fpg/Nei family DNA glycosylase [Bacteroidia bacterium]